MTGSAAVLVYAATSAGVCAAVAAAEAGVPVVLLEPGRHLGGMTSGGLGYTDLGDPRVVGGMAARFRQAVADHYHVPAGSFAGPEPHVAELIFAHWLTDAGVEVLFDHRLTGVETSAGSIQSVTAGPTKTAERTFTAAVFIDASYEGDLLAMAGVPYAVGREDRSLYGERFAGRQELVPGRHTMPPWISPFADDPTGEQEGLLLDQIKAEPLAQVGDGAGGVMSYGYRVCLTQAADRIPFTRRPGYDEAHWELGRRLFEHWRRAGTEVTAGQLIGLTPNLPGGKCDANSLGPFSLNVLDGSAWEYPEADAARREELRLHHLHHAQDFLWFLSQDSCVPAGIRNELNRWGLPTDEFTDTGHLPHQLYVREARRMLGARLLTEHDLLTARKQTDVVAMGSYHLDIREVQRGWRWVYEHPRPVGMVVTEGYLSVPAPPYPIPFSALLPREADCTNLLVPVCLSASHVAFSSIRMEVQYQLLGHATGLAAAQAVRDDRGVHAIDVSRLQDQLRYAGQILNLAP